MAKNVATEALSAIISGNVKKQGDKVVNLDDLRKFGVRSMGDSTYEVGTILHFPETILPGMIEIEEFTAGNRVIKTPCVWVDAELNGVAIAPKKVFITQLIKMIPVWVEENGMFKRVDGQNICSKTELFKELSKFKDLGAVLEACLGRDIEVIGHETGKTAAYTNGVVTGLTDGKVNCFEEVK